MSLIVTYLSCFLTINIYGASKFKEEVEKDRSPVEISADEGEVKEGGRTAVFRKNVFVQKGETTMQCKEMVVDFDEAGKVVSLTCEGDVVIVQKNKRATAKKAVYEKTKEIITLTGSPWVTQGENTFRGEKMRIYVDEDRVEASSVRAKIKPKEKQIKQMKEKGVK